MNDMQPVDLTNCDREPIHIPGAIQPHGALLALDDNLIQVLRHSANAPELLGLYGPINGNTAEAVLGGELLHTLRNAVNSSQQPGRPALLFGQPMPSGALFDIALHRHLGRTIVEFEPATDDGSRQQPLTLARALIGRITRTDSIETLVQQGARLIRAALGYDRVMIYQFESDGAGKVLSEARRPDLESFLGQYFPASDIPQQARALYLRNTIRIISSAEYRPVPLVPTFDAAGAPLDLSYAHLRSVSPIHLEYLRNMGVGASMSISIIVDGALWGLIACHHYSPRTLSMAQRVAAEMFGEFFSLHLGALKQRRSLDTAAQARHWLDKLLQLAGTRDMEELLRESLHDFGRLLPCDGFGLYLNGRWSGFGATPAPTEIPALVAHISGRADSRIWSTHALADDFAAAAEYYQVASGVLAVPLSQLPRDYLFFFRKEMVQTLNWAGNPQKAYETGPMGDRLTPRKSFAIWKETVHRRAQPWTEQDLEIAEAVRAALVEVVLRHNELLSEERAKADLRQRMLNEELNHRVKNILSVIKSLVGQPVQEGRSLEDFVGTLRGRIQALAFAHDQVVRGDGGGALADLIQAELLPYRSAHTTISIEGPPVWIDARSFSVMALVLHELATNAAKYGALSAPGGRLLVKWHWTGTGDCAVDWVERDGPPVTPPQREGFGTALLERSIPYDLGGTSTVSYAREGLHASFCLPARNVRPAQTDERQAGASLPPRAAHEAILGATRLLLVEDQMLIAMDVEAMLAERGLEAVSTANSAEEALRLLRAGRPDAAILDVNLGQSTSLPVAEELRRLGVPFVFATGYGDGNMIPPEFAGVPLVRKPYDIDALLAAVAQVLAQPN